jgi:ubiquinone/menaquinone biosynthesis C-methylase UbiE
VSLYDAFAPIYDDWSAHMTEDVQFYVDLARATEGPLVELAVGNGRVAIPMARETGRRVLGIDASQAMLDQARAEADAGARARSAGRLDLCPLPLAAAPAELG